MNWVRKASSHRARAEQGLDDIAGLDWWVSREGYTRQRERPGQRLGGGCFAQAAVNHCGAGCVGVFVVLGGWQGGPSCEAPGVN